MNIITPKQTNHKKKKKKNQWIERKAGFCYKITNVAI